MPDYKRGLPAHELARDYCTSLRELMREVVARFAALQERDISMPPDESRREICGAVWQVVRASLEATSLSAGEREAVTPLLHTALVPYWHSGRTFDPSVTAVLTQRARAYEDDCDPRSRVATATAIVARLLARLGVADAERQQLERTLVPIFAHRMISDIHRIDDAKARLGICLPVIAAVCVTATAVCAIEPAVRALRLG
jgi:hypothetical protein